ncbi:MAG: alpha/beta fold hydrolase [Roseovarius sp.]
MTYRLADFGSYRAGGRLHEVREGAPMELPVTREVTLTHDPRGTFAVESAYVQYFIPEPRKAAPPVVLVHGGGLSGAVWEATPDGRKGWLHGLLAAGYEVHVVDNVERGRAGFAPGLWPGEPVLRSLEDAWSLFRIGPKEGYARRAAYPGALFPAEAIVDFAKGFAPRWVSTGEAQAAALTAVLEPLEGAILLCHSQGAEPAFAALEQGAEVSHLVAVEPSAGPERPESLAGRGFTLVEGDYLDITNLWRRQRAMWSLVADAACEAGARVAHLASGGALAPGHSHLPMCDRESEACLAAILETL